MIPVDNLRNLMLNDEVVDAVRAGKFHIYAVSTVDEGIEVLSECPRASAKRMEPTPTGRCTHSSCGG